MTTPEMARVFRVAPRAGAWIETMGLRLMQLSVTGRAPCGRVD